MISSLLGVDLDTAGWFILGWLLGGFAGMLALGLVIGLGDDDG